MLTDNDKNNDKDKDKGKGNYINSKIKINATVLCSLSLKMYDCSLPVPSSCCSLVGALSGVF
jgi:hypothetical protein